MQLKLFQEQNKQKVILDLFQAYFDARKNKRNTINALKFEKHFEENIFQLADEITELKYRPLPSICFIVNQPVKREIFAADFRDRVIHHLIYNYISPVFEKAFIHDSYSCRKEKGTYFGIKRVDHFIRSCSKNYQQDAYILKMDIKGYFMAINKNVLFRMIKSHLTEKASSIEFDLPLVLYLIEKTIFNDPKINCNIKGSHNDWQGLPRTKSLFYSRRNCGLPIGNLTSQLFANIYLNPFDHFVKKEFIIKHYGRYVDDFVIIHRNKDYLKSIIPAIRKYLHNELYLTLHPNKIYLQHFSKGVKFLGAVIKPHRIYIANRTTGNFYNAIQQQNKIARNHKPTKEEKYAFLSSMNSYLGILKHYKSFRIRKRFIRKYLSAWWENYFYAKGYAKMVARRKVVVK